MPVIVVASPKGGSGKTTTVFILATQLAAHGLRTCVVDADPNHPIAQWQEDGGKTDNLVIVKNQGEDHVIDDIEAAANDADFVIVDLEGSANLSVAYAISRADYVIVPTQRSKLDAEQAAKAVALIKRQTKIIGREVPFSLLITRTSPVIRTKALRRLVETLEANKIDCFMSEINEREPFKAVFDYATTLDTLPGHISSVEQAKTNAGDFVAEVLIKLKRVAMNKLEAA